MKDTQIDLVRQSFAKVATIPDTAAAYPGTAAAYPGTATAD